MGLLEEVGHRDLVSHALLAVEGPAFHHAAAADAMEGRSPRQAAGVGRRAQPLGEKRHPGIGRHAERPCEEGEVVGVDRQGPGQQARGDVRRGRLTREGDRGRIAQGQAGQRRLGQTAGAAARRMQQPRQLRTRPKAVRLPARTRRGGEGWDGKALRDHRGLSCLREHALLERREGRPHRKGGEARGLGGGSLRFLLGPAHLAVQRAVGHPSERHERARDEREQEGRGARHGSYLAPTAVAVLSADGQGDLLARLQRRRITWAAAQPSSTSIPSMIQL